MRKKGSRSRSPRSVAVLARLDWGFSREAVHGISLYAHEHDWHLHLGPPVPEVLPLLRSWRVDGIVGYVPTLELQRALRRVRRPVVSLSKIIESRSGPLVSADDAATGAAAATHLLDRGFRHFAYLGYADLLYSLDRERGFAATVRAAGHKLSVYHAARPSAGAFPQTLKAFDDAGLSAWLARLPKPVGVMACHDRVALQLAETCRAHGLAVPEQVAIVGADDDEAVCMLARPPLSSVRLPAERVGYEAAVALDALMRGRRVASPVLLLPVRVVTRQSSDVIGVADADVADAVHLIRAVSGRLTVRDLLRQLPVARRTLEAKFARHLGRSPLTEIRQTRVDHARQLLTDSDLPIYEIATRTGFGSPKRFARVFATVTGCTPTAYRRRGRAPSPARTAEPSPPSSWPQCVHRTGDISPRPRARCKHPQLTGAGGTNHRSPLK